MQTTGSIIHPPLIIGLLLSMAVHAVMLLYRGFYTAPATQVAPGRTVVHLTLMPSPLIAVSRPEKTIDPADASDIPFPQPEKATIAAAAIAAPAGIEQHATPDSAEGVISEAEAINGYTPAYPRISKNRGEEGTVTLAVQVLLDGSVGKVELLQSSGFSRLDAAAVKGACKTAFRPAIRSGHAAESTTQLSYTFRLTDD